jgi:hypothetical protein
VIETLRYLRLEVDALLDAVNDLTTEFVARGHILERTQQLFLNWFSNIRPGLVRNGVPSGVLDSSDEVFKRLVQLTAGRSRQEDYARVLRKLKRNVIKALLLEIARLPSEYVPHGVRSAPLIAEIPDVPNEFIPNALYGWIPNIKGFLHQYSFDRNVFIMVSYRSRLARLIKNIRAVLVDLELEAIMARDHSLTDDLYNPVACLLCCNYGIAIFDRAEPGQVHNPNVVYELGMMQLLKRPCLILKHEGLRTMPSDLLSRLYESYGSEQEAARRVQAWWRTRLSGR